MSENSTTNAAELDWSEKIGQPAYASIAEMVAALQCDYERLQELKEERESLQTAIDDACADHEGDDKDAKATIGEAEARAAEALAEWDAENAEELKELEAAAGECKDQDEARQRIEEDALSVEVRSDWAVPGEEMEAVEFKILLSTGGPAVQIVGDLDGNGEPTRARLEVQDWFKPWTEYVPADQGVLLAYARCFCFFNG